MGGLGRVGADGKQIQDGHALSDHPFIPSSSSDGDSDFALDDLDDGRAPVGDNGQPNRGRTLDSMAELEEALPIKRGLSRFYNGKSKSFCNLSELGMEDVRDLGKKEHLVNKRRRLLIAHEYYDDGDRNTAPLDITESSNNSALAHAASMPADFFTDGINEEEEEELEEEEEESENGSRGEESPEENGDGK